MSAARGGRRGGSEPLSLKIGSSLGEDLQKGGILQGLGRLYKKINNGGFHYAKNNARKRTGETRSYHLGGRGVTLESLLKSKSASEIRHIE